MTFRTIGKDPLVTRATLIFIGFIISAITFAGNTKTPLNNGDQPQYYFTSHELSDSGLQFLR